MSVALPGLEPPARTLKRRPAPRCYQVMVDGEVAIARFTREPTEADLAAFRDVIRALRSRLKDMRGEP